MATLLTGLTFNDLHSFAKQNSNLGLPRDITQKSLNSFEYYFGRTPGILQLAFPDLSGNKKGYLAPKKVLTQIGERVEADFIDIEFNDITYTPTPTPSTASKRSKQAKILTTFGGVTASLLNIDVYIGRIGGTLVDSTASALTLVQSTHQDFKIISTQFSFFPLIKVFYINPSFESQLRMYSNIHSIPIFTVR